MDGEGERYGAGMAVKRFARCLPCALWLRSRGANEHAAVACGCGGYSGGV